MAKELILDNDELKSALDHWLREVHPTLMEKSCISSMVVTSYPAKVALTISQKPDE